MSNYKYTKDNLHRITHKKEFIKIFYKYHIFVLYIIIVYTIINLYPADQDYCRYYTRRQINQDGMIFGDFSVNYEPIFLKFCKGHILFKS